MHSAWVEVDLAAIRHNYRELKRFTGPEVAVMAVIKANAYGHGLERVAEALREEADWFGVSTVEEGIRARAAAPDARILVFHPANVWNAGALVAHRLTATLDSVTGAEALAEAGRRTGVEPEAHLKLDMGVVSGMARFGVGWRDEDTLHRVACVPGIRWTGMYTHLATASNGPRDKRALAAFHGFGVLCHTLHRAARCPDDPGDADLERPWPLGATAFYSAAEWRHALNSSGTLEFLSTDNESPPGYGQKNTNLVRVGTLLYGQYPSRHAPRALDLRPTWTFKARIVSLRRLPSGAPVGYGSEWYARRDSLIATIPVGYADGFTVEPRSVWRRQGGLKGVVRRLRGQDAVTVKTPHGRARVVGRVASQSAMLDVTGLAGVAVGDIVEIPARRVLVGDHIPRLYADG